jgi:sulfate permease, SulP family
MRGCTRVGATLIEVLDDYADALAAVGGRLYLSGVAEGVARQLQRSGKLDLERSVQITTATDVLGDSTGQAVASAREWLRGPQS